MTTGDQLAHVPPIQVIKPSPVPLTFRLDTVRVATKDAVVLRVFSPTGQSVYFLDPDQADALGKSLCAASLRAKTGLVIGAVEIPTS